jgi:hypothetical protein
MIDLTAVRDEDRFDIAKMHAWLRPFINQDQLPECQTVSQRSF